MNKDQMKRFLAGLCVIVFLSGVVFFSGCASPGPSKLEQSRVESRR